MISDDLNLVHIYIRLWDN